MIPSSDFFDDLQDQTMASGVYIERHPESKEAVAFVVGSKEPLVRWAYKSMRDMTPVQAKHTMVRDIEKALKERQRDLNEPDFNSIDGDLTADFDQAKAHVSGLVPLIATMYRGLRAEGLGVVEACGLTAAHMWYWAHPIPEPQEPDEEGDDSDS